jgi:dihydrofolate synthase/folylpolyglutamate synthase
MKHGRFFKSNTDVFSYFESFTNFEKTGNFSERLYRHDRMSRLLDLFETPHLAYKTFHIAGTKGKGSTACFIASILSASGYKTGLYTSPHISHYGERITIDQKKVESALLIDTAHRIKDKISTLTDFQPTTFELLTLLAFLAFQEKRCEYAVIEVGIGGRLDATNVVFPLACIITPIELEHTDVLGSTITAVASEKAGIIKQGIPVFSGFQQPSVKQILNEKSIEKHAEIRYLDESIRQLTSSLSEDGTEMTIAFKDRAAQSFTLSMIGHFQAENAALAILTLNAILPDIPFESYKEGLGKAFLPGRMEIIQRIPPVILDGAHTPLAVEKTLQSFKTLYSDPGVLIFGSVQGKNHEKMAAILAHEFRRIVITTPGSYKESDPDTLFSLFIKKNPGTILEKNPEKALKKALHFSQHRLPIFVTGSFYMVAEIRKLFRRNMSNRRQRT